MQDTTIDNIEATPDHGEAWPTGVSSTGGLAGDTCVAENCLLFGAFFCSSCLIARYCSQECQRIHRPSHKKECKLLTKARLASVQSELVQAALGSAPTGNTPL